MAKQKGKEPKVRDDWTQTMLTRADLAFSHDSENRRRAEQHMKFLFVPGNQWDDHMRLKRPNKPCYEFNILRPKAERLIGQQLKNKPQIKVRATEDRDVDVANVFNGLIKNIEVQSHAEIAYDTAFRWSVGGGHGVLRVVSEYEQGDSFDQCLKICDVPDPLSVYVDPGSQRFDWSDATYMFVVSSMPKGEFKRRHPDVDEDFFIPASLDRLEDGWIDESSVRVAEYWWREPYKKKIYQLSTGEVVEAEEFDPIRDEWENPPIDPMTGQPAYQAKTIENEREVDCHKVYSCLVSGKGKLTEKNEWAGTMIPIVPQWGNYYMINGKTEYCGMTSYAADSQRLHNFQMSTAMEVLAKMPNSPLMATGKQVEGLESYYERMGYDDPPVLLYNVDPLAPNSVPQRQPLAQFPAAMIQMAQVVSEEIKSTTGIYDASVGAGGNETSGRAIVARQSEADLASFVYIDNQMKAIKRLGEILVDAIPRVYDTERSIRILDETGAESFVKINQPMQDRQTGETHTINDLSRGKYDVTVTVGKAFDTMRMEMAEVAQALSAGGGPLAMVGQYMLIKSLDVPGVEEFTDPLRKALVQQGLLEPSEEEKEQMAQQPQQPDPRAVAELEKMQAEAMEVQARTQELSSRTELNQIRGQQIMAMTPVQIAETEAKIEEGRVNAGVSVAKTQQEGQKIQISDFEARTDAENAAIDRVVEMNNRSYPVY